MASASQLFTCHLCVSFFNTLWQTLCSFNSSCLTMSCGAIAALPAPSGRHWRLSPSSCVTSCVSTSHIRIGAAGDSLRDRGHGEHSSCIAVASCSASALAMLHPYVISFGHVASVCYVCCCLLATALMYLVALCDIARESLSFQEMFKVQNCET